jgi:hypothetical protein
LERVVMHHVPHILLLLLLLLLLLSTNNVHILSPTPPRVMTYTTAGQLCGTGACGDAPCAPHSGGSSSGLPNPWGRSRATPHICGAGPWCCWCG